MTALYSSAPVLAERLLGDSRCTLLLRILALSLPLSAAHAAISGYCYGKKQAAPPAVCQLLEQLVRIATLVLIANRMTASGVQPGAWAAALSLLVGETASLTFSAFCLSILLRKDALNFSNTLFLGNTSDTCSGEQTDFSSSGPSLFSRIRAILRMSFPLAANRLLLGLLQSLEAVQIPARLILFGSSSEEALSIYGVLTGMALPFLFFPFALTNSVSVLLLPSVAEAQSLGDDARIRRTIELALSYSLYIGILCTGIFAVYGKAMGQLFFPDTAAGSYLVGSWLALPFSVPCFHGCQHPEWNRTNRRYISAESDRSRLPDLLCDFSDSSHGNPRISVRDARQRTAAGAASCALSVPEFSFCILRLVPYYPSDGGDRGGGNGEQDAAGFWK